MFKRLLLCLPILFILASCQSRTDSPQVDESVDAISDSPTVTVAATREISEAEAVPSVAAMPTGVSEMATAEPVATSDAPPEPTLKGSVDAPEFPLGLDWLNVAQPLTMAELQGKVVLLDFWTYGCINCIHVIPELKQLEEKYADSLVVIGVHSAKFTNESETENIRQILQRYEVDHPVINDRDFEIWRTYGVEAWPTFVMIDPDGHVLGFHAGEGIYDLFDQVIGRVVEEFEAAGRLTRSPLELTPESANLPPSPLLFPGKVLADSASQRLFIADSNHNRIVITDFDGNVLQVIGNGQATLQDGDFESASFFRPQGMALADANTLYVADTENHAIRRIYLDSERVTTVAGDGTQVYMRQTRGNAWELTLNSPWDVLYHDEKLHIAMAGQHQLWTYDPATEQLFVLAGSGREELTDGPQRSNGLNQPSGLATDGEQLYFADSEASAIRTAGFTPDGTMETLVGTGLFDFGDVDGVGAEVRLQHPLGIAYHTGMLFVADTYNNKIKLIDPIERSSRTFAGSGEAGWLDGEAAQFSEPGGLSIAGGKLYVADTNNHVIRVIDIETERVTTLVLVDAAGLLTRQPAGTPFPGETFTLDPVTISLETTRLSLDVSFPNGYKLNELAPFSAEWRVEGEMVVIDAAFETMSITNPSFPLDIPITAVAGSGTLVVELVVYYCEAETESLCLIEHIQLVQPLMVQIDGVDALTISYHIADPSGEE